MSASSAAQARSVSPQGLPGWVWRSAAWRSLSAGARLTLIMMADRGRLCHDGGIDRIVGGWALIEQIGCSRRTFWQYLRRLTAAGLVVVLVRGGGPVRGEHQNVTSEYGIPPAIGAWDAFAVDRDFRQMHRDERGVFVPNNVPVGQTATIWQPEDSPPEPRYRSGLPRRMSQDGCEMRVVGADRGVFFGRGLHGGRENSARPPCKDRPGDHVPYPVIRENSVRDYNPSSGGDGARGRRPRPRAWPGRSVDVGELVDAGCMVALLQAAQAGGLVSCAEADVHWFMSLGSYSHGKKPAPVGHFVVSVRRGPHGWGLPEYAQREGAKRLREARERGLL